MLHSLSRRWSAIKSGIIFSFESSQILGLLTDVPAHPVGHAVSQGLLNVIVGVVAHLEFGPGLVFVTILR
jgi:hypothetical protein